MGAAKSIGQEARSGTIEIKTQSIPRISLSDQHHCQRILRENKPVILENAMASWSALGTWTPEYFAETLPDYEILLYEFTRRDVLPSSFADFTQYLRTGERTGDLSGTRDPLYLAWDARVLSASSILRDGFDFRPLFGKNKGITQTAFWMGGRGSHTPLHRDIDAQNLHAVVYGQKKILLFSPQDSAFLDPSDIYEWTTTFSSIDFRNPDSVRHPLLLKATGYEAVLGPGDMVFIPTGWWHTVTCLEPTISVNGWRFRMNLLWSLNMYRDLLRRVLHHVGLYRRNRCTCHGHGDLRKHLDWDP